MFYYRDFLTKVIVILPRNSANPLCFGHLKQCDMNRTNPICVISPKAAKANRIDLTEHLYRKTAALRYHRCLINICVDKMNNL